jgi:hypothetical protein
VDGLQLGIAGDVDLLDGKAELGPQLLQHRARTVAEVTTLRRVEADFALGYG